MPLFSSLLDISSRKLREIDEWFANGGVGVVEIVEKFAEFFGVEANGLDADLVEARDDGFDAIVEFVDGFVVDVAVDAGDGGTFVLTHGFEEVLGLVDGALDVGGAVVRDDDEEGFVHDIGLFGEDFDELEIVVHEDAEKHVVVVAAHGGQAFDVGADVDFLGADEDLDGEVEGVEEVLVAVFDAFAFGFGHEVEVNGLASDDGAEGAVFHDDEAVAELREEESGLGGEGVVGDGGRLSGRDGGDGGGNGGRLSGGGGGGWSGGCRDLEGLRSGASSLHSAGLGRRNGGLWGGSGTRLWRLWVHRTP